MTYLDRALSHVAALDDLARRETPLTRLDPRAKVIVTFAFLVTVASFGRHQVSQPLPLLVYLAAAMAFGDIPWRVVLARLAIASPFAILVGMWNPIFEAQLVQLGPWTIAAGWLSLVSILERFSLALMIVLLLLATTGMDAVAAALGRLGMPRVLVTQVLLLHRYGFVLGAEISRMMRAHLLRAAGRAPELSTARSMLGGLFLRSIARAERVHEAMLCRGFDGVVRRRSRMHLGARDALFVCGSTGFFALVRLVDLPRLLEPVFS